MQREIARNASVASSVIPHLRQILSSVSKSDTKLVHTYFFTMAVDDLRQNNTMAHILEALDDGKDIGHYGRLTFAMVAQYFADEQEIVKQLQKDKDFSEEEAKSLYQQVTSKHYSPPSRDSLLEWQSNQDFQIVPDPEDPDSGNVYQDLTFPKSVYESISHYNEEKSS